MTENQNKKNENENEVRNPNQQTDIFDELLDSGFLGEEDISMVTGENVFVVHKGKMTVLELAEVIETLSSMASDLTLHLAKACGICNGCLEENPCTDGDNFQLDPVHMVKNCSLCQELLEDSQDIHIPDYILEEAGIPLDAKLEAYANEEGGEILVMEAEIQTDIRDVPLGILGVLADSGCCIASLDELIMGEEIVYGE